MKVEGVVLSAVGSHREPVRLALLGHTLYAASLLRGKSDNRKGDGESRRERICTSSDRSTPTEHGGFWVEAVWAVGP